MPKQITPARTRKITIVLLIVTQLALIALWAMNGYEDTWFYIMLILLTVSTSLMNIPKGNSIN